MTDDKQVRPVLPASLLVEGRPCLIVGGGKIAARKAGHLLDAGAKVNIVRSEVTDEIARLIESGSLHHLSRDFADQDVDGMYLVFAATDDDLVNRRVIECCREKNVLCSAIDSNWTDGDFVTPAICRKKGLVVSVSTGGRSCRRARLVKEQIARLIDNLPEDLQDQ